MPRPGSFHICVQYYRQPTPRPEEWLEDLKHVQRLGFTGVQLRPQWAWHEPEEGRLRWDDLDRLIGITSKLGLKVLFKFLLESAPHWLFRNYDSGRVAPDGTPILHRARSSYYLGGWWPCFDRPLVREKARRFVEEGVQRYRAADNILGWHIWNEPRSRPFQDCACPDSNAAYRAWLEQTYGSIGEFNDRFGTVFGKWDDLRPPPDLSGYYDSWIWRTWRAHAIAERMRWVASLVRGQDSTRPLFCHVGFDSVLQPTLTDTSFDLLTAKAVDVYGSSLPHWTGDQHSFWDMDRLAQFCNPDYRQEYYLYALQARWLASVTDYFWINEIYGNSWNYLAPDFSGEDLRFMMLSVLAEGARGMVIWQFRPERFGEESVTSGLIAPDGSDTDRSLAAGDICAARQRHPEAFDTFTPEKADVAVVFDFGADMYSAIEDAEDLPRAGTVCYRYKESLKGYWSLLWQLGQPVDFIPAELLEERIGDYRLVVLPYWHLVDRQRAAALERFVSRGGTLVSDPGLAFRDTRAWVQHVRPGQGLDKLFGCRENFQKAIRRPRKIEVMGIGVTACQILGGLTPQGGGEDLSGGAGLAVSNRRGKGRTFYFAFYPGLSYRQTGEPACLALMEKILGSAGLADRRPLKDKLVILRRGTVGQDRKRPAALVFNYEPQTVKMPAGLLEPGNYRCVLTGKKIEAGESLGLAAREILFLVAEKPET